MSKVRVDFQGSGFANIEDLNEFQGGLKTLSDENYEKFKNEILELGFSEPVSVWKNKGKVFILNGHQRIKTLTNMKAEGVEIPKIPVNFIKAKSIKEAKKKVLALTSQFGQISPQGLMDFMSFAELKLEDLENFRFSDLNMAEFKDFFSGFKAGSQEDQQRLDEKHHIIIECPNCGEKFESGQAKPED